MQRQELLTTLVLANAFKEGDLALGGTRDEQVRTNARQALAALRVRDIMATPCVDDGVSDALHRALSPTLVHDMAHLTMAEVRRILLGSRGAQWVQHYRDGLASEAIAAVVKIMTNEELGRVARALYNPLPGEGVTLGAAHHFGSRIQPNSPGDDEEEILFAILEGLTYGCGDVIIGVNPASDDVDTIVRLEDLLRSVVERLRLPTRYCVLSDIVKQTRARAHTQVDVGFQSLAGTSQALRGMVGLDIDGLLELARGFRGLYFETGQGAEVTNGAAAGVDMVTLEARTYGVARCLRQQTGAWTIVNDVAGFIGPEVFRTTDQLLRTCYEDMVMAKLHGLTMGLDVCATLHMGITPAALHDVTATIVQQAAPAYLMAVAGNADPMLGYLTTSFREHPRLRHQTGRQLATAMQRRLRALGLLEARGQSTPSATQTTALYALYRKAGGETQPFDMLCAAGQRTLARLQQRGLDLGYGCEPDYAPPADVETRLATIYTHARQALYATLEDGVLRAISPQYLRVRTQATSRDEYLAHPAAGEAICAGDAQRLATLYPTHRPQVQLVLSDGLNAHALHEHGRAVLPPLRQQLGVLGCQVGAWDVVVDHGRVRAGYHIGELLQPEVVLHLIGERPGTGLHTLSAYCTYGRDPHGQWRWRPALDHACTTAICGMHQHGKRPEVAVQEIVQAVQRMLEQRCSGIALSTAG
jgi:ethanolamine ammonia-lyase large subunit